MSARENDIRFIDLAAQQELILPAINQRIKNVLAHGQYIMGPEVAELERTLETYLGVKYAITCASGTDALLMALMSIGIGPGDAVLTTPFTFVATAEVIALLGATPVFVDVDSGTFNLDPDCLEAALAALMGAGNYPLPRGLKQDLTPKCIIPVDLFGLPANYDRINAIAEKYNLIVLADAAQSFGATIHDKKACTCAHIAATSFFPSKPLGCYGDGGAVFTSDEVLSEKLKSIRAHGKGREKYDNVRIGINGRMDTIQAAILLEKMMVFDHELALRQDIASRYQNFLGHDTALQVIPDNFKSVWAQFSVLSEDREMLINRLGTENIPTAIYYPRPLHLQKAFNFLNYTPEDFPVSTRLSRTIFSLPMHPYLKFGEVDRICDLLLNN